MKKCFLLMLISITIGLLSCKKEIPKPNDSLTETVNPNPFYFSGMVNGNFINKIVDGNQYIGITSSQVYSGPNIITWGFSIKNLATEIDEFNFLLFNYSDNINPTYSDIEASTSGTQFDFIQSSTTDHYKKIIIGYFGDDSNYYSTVNADNSPLSILNISDTIVDNKSYRIVEVSGSINLTTSDTTQIITIPDFKARIAFSMN